MTEGPYKLPQGWKWVKLGEICLPTERRDPTKEPDRSFLYVDISSVDNGLGKVVDPKELLGKNAPSRARKVIRKDDIIFATTRPYLKNIAIVGIELDNQICSTGFCVLRAKRDTVEPRFLFHVCRSDLVVKQLLGGNMRGASYPAVTDNDVFKSLIPLPPLEWQRRIVARIEELMSRIREAKRLHQEAKEDAGRLMQAALVEVFPRPGAQLPQGWRWVKLGEVAWRESMTLRPDNQPNAVFLYIGMEHIAPGQWEEPAPVELRGSEIKSQVIAFRPGLVLYGKLRPYLNKVFVPSFKGVASTEFVPIATKDDVLDPRYLGAFLRSPDFVAYATRNTTGSRQPRVRFDALWNAPLPLPPLEEQKRIVAYLEALQDKITALRTSQETIAEDLRRLEQSILDRAFRGEL